jgi:hypothetical protein
MYPPHRPRNLVAALLQERGNGRLEPEAKSLSVGLAKRGIPTQPFLEKKLHRRQLELHRDVLVAGHIPVVLGALRQLGIEPPEPNDYPASLSPWLRRRLWKSSVADVVTKLQDGAGRPFFAKPLDRHKRFRGSVVQSWEDLRALGGASNRATVWCSEIVEWKSEFRVYVVKGRILGIGHYAGDPSRKVDEKKVEEAVASFEASGEAPGGYGIDFGVLSTGQTALVEINDGYSLGNYGLDDDLYTELIVSRWLELTHAAPARE